MNQYVILKFEYFLCFFFNVNVLFQKASFARCNGPAIPYRHSAPTTFEGDNVDTISRSGSYLLWSLHSWHHPSDEDADSGFLLYLTNPYIPYMLPMFKYSVAPGFSQFYLFLKALTEGLFFVIISLEYSSNIAPATNQSIFHNGSWFEGRIVEGVQLFEYVQSNDILIII